MFGRKLATQTASPAPTPAERTAAPARSALGLAGAALLFLAAAAALLAVRGNPYDGAPVVRVRVSGPLAAAPAASAKGAAVPTEIGALEAAPIAGLTAPGPGGLLPIIAADGRASWKAYARPFNDDGRPKIALVIGGLGLNAEAAHAVISSLPPEVTLAFSPYAEGLQGLIDAARAAGHEVMVEMPMEPLDYPDTDPGPYTLVANTQPVEITHRMEWLLSRATGYFGVINSFGGRFLSQEKPMQAFAQVLRQRGLAFIDDGQGAGRGGDLRRASAAVRIDGDLDSAAIDNQLLALEAQALQKGGAVGVGSGYPLTVSQVQAWATAVRDRGYALAPASALMTSRP